MGFANLLCSTTAVSGAKSDGKLPLPYWTKFGPRRGSTDTWMMTWFAHVAA